MENQLIEVPAYDDSPENELTYDPTTCAQFAAAFAYSLAYEHQPLPDNLSQDAKSIISNSFGALSKNGALDGYPEDSPVIRNTLGNRSAEINDFCSNGGRIFDDSKD